MRRFLKYILAIITLIILILLYLRYTESGQKNAYTIVGLYASYNMGVDIKIQDVNLTEYPNVKANIILDTQYRVALDGFMKDKHINFHYHLLSDCFTSNLCTFDDIIDVQGKITGHKNRIHVTGKGKALDGNVSYSLVKEKTQFKDVNVILQEINSNKLFTLLGEKTIFKTKVNAHITFDYIEEDSHVFDISLRSKEIRLHITEGNYQKNKETAQAKYSLHIPDLSLLGKKLLTNYHGTLNISGKLDYKDKSIKVFGTSKDFGGALYFNYEDNETDVLLKNISTRTLMKTFNMHPIVDANISGEGVYNVSTKQMDFQAKLGKVKLLSSPILKTIEETLSLPLENEIFNKSSFDIHFKNNTYHSNFHLANNKMHLILTDTTFSDVFYTVSSNIDFKIPKHAAKGRLTVKTDNSRNTLKKNYALTFNGTLEKHYQIKLDGNYSDTFMNLSYDISAKRLPSHICTIIDDINLSGHIQGTQQRLLISGSGMAMEGKVKYALSKQKDHYEDVSLTFKDIHTLKLFTLLGQPEFPNGKADFNATLSYVSPEKILGEMHYTLKNGVFQTVPLQLHTNVIMKKKKVFFNTQAKLASADINISDGLYDIDTNTSQAFYTLSTQNLAPLEPIIGKYLGTFNARGEIQYKDGLQIRGLTNTFGGMIDFLYKKDMLYVDLEKVSLTRFMYLFPYPHRLKAQINGNINYDYTKKQVLIRTDLNDTVFLKSEIVDTIYQKSGINLLQEIFSHSTLFAIYQNGILAGDLLLKNKQSHFYLKNTQINTNKNNVNAHFDLRMQGQEFSGKVYGSLQDPKVKLNMEKLIRYQMDKQLDSVIGKGNRKLMESMPMGGTAKDMATDVGAGIMEMFF